MERRFDALFLGMLNFDISVAGFAAEMCSRKQSYVPRIALGTGGDALQTCHALHIFLSNELLHSTEFSFVF